MRYERVISGLSGIDFGKIDNAGGFARGLADRAYEAEHACRVILAESLDAINDLRDGGTLYPLCADAAKRLGSLTPEDISVQLRQAQKQAGSTHPAFAEAFALGSALVTDLGLSSSVNDDDTITVTRKPIGSKKAASISISLHPKPGQSARVSSEQLFATGVMNTVRLLTPIDCHHNPLHASLDRVDSPTSDLYTAALGGIASAMALFYEHARRIDELGPQALLAADPGTIGIIIIVVLIIIVLVAAAGLIIYGLVAEDGNFIFAGFLLLLLLAAFLGFRYAGVGQRRDDIRPYEPGELGS
jgi:hypothetical protein